MADKSRTLSPGRALRPEVRMNKEQEEALMTTRNIHEEAGPISHDEAESIAMAYIDKAFGNPEKPGRRVRHCIPANPREDTDIRLMAYIKQQRAAASRLVEIESALAHIQASGHCGADIMSPERIIAWATELGWTSPTQNPNDGGRDGKA